MKHSIAIMVSGEALEMQVGSAGLYAGAVDALEETDVVCMVTELEDGSLILQNVIGDTYYDRSVS